MNLELATFEEFAPWLVVFAVMFAIAVLVDLAWSAGRFRRWVDRRLVDLTAAVAAISLEDDVDAELDRELAEIREQLMSLRGAVGASETHLSDSMRSVAQETEALVVWRLKKPSGANKPHGACLNLIEDKFETLDNFKEEFSSVAMSIQGSGWVYLSNKGDIKTIENHQIKNDIALLVDWWEHAWALDYQSDKRKYLQNIWKIIDWSVVNDRINVAPKRARKEALRSLYKISLKKV